MKPSIAMDFTGFLSRTITSDFHSVLYKTVKTGEYVSHALVYLEGKEVEK